jgi:hypothetical protein
MSKTIFFFGFFFVFFVHSCGVSSSKALNQTQMDSTANFKIAFLYFTIQKGTNKSQLNLTKTLIREGMLKPVFNKTNLSNYLHIALLQNGKQVDSFNIEHPLYKNIEFINENHQPEAQFVQLDSATFVLRMQINVAKTNELTIFEQLKGKPANKIYTQHL